MQNKYVWKVKSLFILSVGGLMWKPLQVFVIGTAHYLVMEYN